MPIQELYIMVAKSSQRMAHLKLETWLDGHLDGGGEVAAIAVGTGTVQAQKSESAMVGHYVG